MTNDPFEGMRNAIQAVRVRLGNPEALCCNEALWFHTMGAARVLGSMARSTRSRLAGKPI